MNILSASKVVDLSSYLSDDFATSLFDSVVGRISGLTNICFLLCGLFAFAYFANMLMKTWAKGEAIDFHALLKPFVIGVITINFTFVYELVDGVFEPINNYTAEISQVDDASVEKVKGKLEKIKEEYENMEAEYDANEKTSFWRGVIGVTSMTKFFDNLYLNCIDLLLWGLEYVSAIAFGAVKLVIRTVSLAFRIVLIVFGPFAFALSVLPMFSDNWKNWIVKYLNVSLFVPIANLMDLIISQLHLTLIQSHIDVYQTAITQMGETGSPVESTMSTLTISYIIFLIAFLVLYLMVPSIASYIVNSSSMESLTGGITMAGSFAAAKMLSGTVQNPLSSNVLKLFNRGCIGKKKISVRTWIPIPKNEIQVKNA